MTSLLEQFFRPGVDQAQLELMVQSYFNSARSATPDEVTYPEGPTLKASDLDALSEQVTRDLLTQE